MNYPPPAIKKLIVFGSSGDEDRRLKPGESVYYVSTGRLSAAKAQVLNDGRRLNGIAAEQRLAFSQFIYGLNGWFLESNWVFKGQLSWFLASDASNKRTEKFQTYHLVCHGLVLREKIAAMPFLPEVEFAGCSPAVENAIRSSLALPGLRTGGTHRVVASVALLLKQIFFFTKSALAVAMFRLGPNDAYSGARKVFLSRYPIHFSPEFEEDKYGAMIGSRDGILVSVLADGIHQNLSLREVLRCTRRCIESKKNIFVLDRLLSLKDVIAGLANAPASLIVALRFSCRRIEYLGIDISAALADEVWMGALRAPRLAMYFNAFRTFFATWPAEELVYYLHEYAYGRFVSFAMHATHPQIRRTGFQHGPCSRRRLVYYMAPGESATKGDFLRHTPVPDAVLAEDLPSAEVYMEAGYKNVSVMENVPRLAYLADTKIPRPKAGNAILVACGLHDAPDLWQVLQAEIRSNAETVYYFRLHPRARNANALKGIIASGAIANLRAGDGHLTEIFGKVDSVVVSYSSVGTEAAMLGIPVRLVDLPHVVSESPLLDLSDADGWVRKLPVGMPRQHPL